MIVIILNGYPESGKDEFIKVAEKWHICYNYSTIDECKDICEQLGWDGVKDDKSRKMLSDLKQWYVEHLDGVFKDFTSEVQRVDKLMIFDIFFVVTREGKEINRFKEWLKENHYTNHYLFMSRGAWRDFGNDSDNKVLEVVKPDIYLNNNGELTENVGHAMYDTTSAVNNIKLLCGSGNITSGTFILYGVNS